MVRAEMHSKLSDSQTAFQTLTLTLEEYNHSLIENDEIRVNRTMYDVKSATIVGNIVKLVVICDKEEEAILDDLEIYFEQPNQTGVPLHQQLQQLVSLSYLLPPHLSLSIESLISEVVFHSYRPNILSGYMSQATPPPEVA